MYGETGFIVGACDRSLFCDSQGSLYHSERSVQKTKTTRIIYGEKTVCFPDGACLGAVGEHNAVQLQIVLPSEMVERMDYHTVNIGGVESAIILDSHENVDGAFRSGNTIYQPLTFAYTQNRIVSVTVTAYKQSDESPEIVNISPTAHGLYFSSGSGKSVPSGLSAEVYALHQDIEKLKSLVGDSGIMSATINENGELLLTLSDNVSDAYIDENGNLNFVYKEENNSGNN